ncbi:MAG TPA: hypothetical protein VEI52_08240 [Terriglobales bacterium]|nr:hypothetical protein [Terriglobales bacterium]
MPLFVTDPFHPRTSNEKNGHLSPNKMPYRVVDPAVRVLEATAAVTIGSTELFAHGIRIPVAEDVMKAYFTNLPTRTWLLYVIPVVILSYPIVRIVVPAVINAVVPETVRTVLHLI